MNEEPKNIWEISRPTSYWFRVWLVLLAATFFIFFAVLGLGGNLPTNLYGWLIASVVALIFSAIVAAVMWCLWMLVRSLFCRLNFKRLFFGLACLATLIALFYTEEDWRGWHAWQKFKHQWEAKGERFDAASVIPPAVPDDQNFALTPIVASAYEGYFNRAGHELNPRNTNVASRLQMTCSHNDYHPTDSTGNWQKSTVSDLGVWQRYYRDEAARTNDFPVAPEPQSPAADVLLALSKYDSAIEELRRAGGLPDSRFPLVYDKECPAALLLPHLRSLRDCVRVLQLRALAELQNGQGDQALADIQLMLRLANSVQAEPILISQLVRLAIVNLALQPVWEGLARHQWSDAQLAALNQELAGMGCLPDYQLAMRGELVLFQGGMFDFLRRHPEQFPDWSADGNPMRAPLPARLLWQLVPIGWLYQNQLHAARPMVEGYLPSANVSQGIISPAASRQAGARVQADIKHFSPFNLAEKLFLPAVGQVPRRFALSQASVALAQTAIALERYRLAHGDYPESLDALAPQFIAKVPHDIINGQPLHYRPEAGGQFVLYSVGWNEKDDDGVVVLKNGTSPGVDPEKGDWVWRYPAK